MKRPFWIWFITIVSSLIVLIGLASLPFQLPALINPRFAQEEALKGIRDQLELIRGTENEGVSSHYGFEEMMQKQIRSMEEMFEKQNTPFFRSYSIITFFIGILTTIGFGYGAWLLFRLRSLGARLLVIVNILSLLQITIGAMVGGQAVENYFGGMAMGIPFFRYFMIVLMFVISSFYFIPLIVLLMADKSILSDSDN